MTQPITRSKSLVLAEAPETRANDRVPRSRRRGTAFADRGSSLLNHALLGLVVVGALGTGIASWSATVPLAGAVIASGRVVVDSNVKRVQHPTGGVIGSIRVRNGDRVDAGDLLLTIDDRQVQAASQINAQKLTQLENERARLFAERENSDAMRFPAALDPADPAARRNFDDESRLLSARRQSWATQRSRHAERITQLRKEIDAIIAQRTAKEREIDLIRQELKLVDELHKRQLANVTRLIGMKREVARFEGERGALDAQIARAESGIAEIELQIAELDQRILADVHKQIRDIEGQISEISERKSVTEEQVRRIQIRAPVAGRVHELSHHTVGGVVRAAETILIIVPDQDVLSAEVQVAPRDIDQVASGQRALLRFTSLSKERTPEARGTVVHVGADLSRDPQTGREFFVARIEVQRNGGGASFAPKLSPGMPVESFIETETRTALSYLLKPLTDQLARAMREH